MKKHLVIFVCLFLSHVTRSQIADQKTYLADIQAIMKTEWPKNRTVNLVFHGHSVPAGYFKTPTVNPNIDKKIVLTRNNITDQAESRVYADLVEKKFEPYTIDKSFLVKNVLSNVMGLPYIFIPVGGLTDASSLVGHNYTYEGSIPGIII